MASSAVDSGKEILMARLKTADEGPGYCHFPINADRGYDETYIKGLSSEQRVIQFKDARKSVFASVPSFSRICRLPP